jgi:hypothetical protein
MACIDLHIHLSALHVTCSSCHHHATLVSGTGALTAWARAHQQPWLIGLTSSLNQQPAVYQPMRTPRLLR